ncbi:MAG: hypothetical protein ACYDH4_10920 [Candidatus Cryosericum sp.]
MTDRPPRINVVGLPLDDLTRALRTSDKTPPDAREFIDEVLGLLGHPEGFARESSLVLFCSCRQSPEGWKEPERWAAHGTRDDQRKRLLDRFGIVVTETMTMGELFRLHHLQRN